MKTKLLLLIGLIASAVAYIVFASSNKEVKKAPTFEFSLKVENLLNKMTIEEKIGQLNQHAGFSNPTGPVADNESDQLKVNRVKAGLVGAMLNVVGTKPVGEIQRLAVEESRLGIPLLFGYDVIHGHKTIFPIPLAEASSWDLEAVKLSARVSATEASAQGVNWTFAPMVDISRDPRWGRVMEGAGEDPYLGTLMGISRIEGFQGDDLTSHDSIAACLKHFAAYGFAEAGRDYNRSEISMTTLHNVVLPPFKEAVEKTDVLTVMNAFNINNGIPATADSYLQRDLLKGQWGFDGFVVSDWGSVIEMVPHGYAQDFKEAAKLGITAGSDMEMETGAYFANLKDLVESGDVDIDHIDDAVRRILTVKYKLGLFDDPYRYINVEREAETIGAPEHLEAALSMAKKSIVLLKNENQSLPISSEQTLAVIGALAADKDAPIGNWRASGVTRSAVSLIEGLEEAGVKFEYAKGADVSLSEPIMANEIIINETDTSEIGAAVELAKKVDKVIMVLGEVAHQSGESRNRTNLGFPGVQQELLQAVHAVNPNIVLVVMSGRPLILTWADENIPAILQTWHLGTQSGHAITSVLTGDYNPSGKLTMTFPRSVGQIPIYYNRFNTGRPGPLEAVWWSHYIDESNAPLYPFGHGLSYTSFAYSDLNVKSTRSQGKPSVNVSVTLTNTGNQTGEEVAQLYIHDVTSKPARPIRELKGFEKVALAANESTTINFTLSEDELGYYNQKGEYILQAGEFDIYVGGNSDATLKGNFTWK